MYQPLKLFVSLGLVLAAMGGAVGLRFMWFYVTMGGAGHVQSLILAGVLAIVGFQIVMMGLLADLIAGNRRISEDALYRIKQLELDLAVPVARARLVRPEAPQGAPSADA